MGIVKGNGDKESNKEEIKNKKIIINGEQIGQNLERRFERKYISDFGRRVTEQEYVESFEKDEDRILEIRYYYVSYRHFFRIVSKLKIKYRIKYKAKDKDNFPWNTLIIKDFADLDYQIDIPDKGYTLPGSQSNEEISEKKVNTDKIDISEVRSKGRGKLKVNGKYLTAKGLKPIKEKEDPKLICKLSEGDTLEEIAKDFLGQESRWDELKKEDGSQYTKKDKKNFKAGAKVVIPYDKKKNI
jgi:hypothetical protein